VRAALPHVPDGAWCVPLELEAGPRNGSPPSPGVALAVRETAVAPPAPTRPTGRGLAVASRARRGAILASAGALLGALLSRRRR
jgi:hypothetical protein